MRDERVDEFQQPGPGQAIEGIAMCKLVADLRKAWLALPGELVNGRAAPLCTENRVRKSILVYRVLEQSDQGHFDH